MNPFLRRLSRSVASPFVVAAAFAAALPASAHESRVGAIEIVHPFATPTLAGTKHGAAYLLHVENKGAVADRIVRASTTVAARVELHTMAVDAQGVMRMRQVDAIGVDAKSKVSMRPGLGYHLMLMELKQPLKEGDAFAMTVVFEKAGSVDVKVVVQAPKAGGHRH